MRGTRAPDLLVGVALAAVLLAGILLWMGRFDTSVRSGARDFDARSRQRNAYLGQLCRAPSVTDDEARLCGCVRATEDPSRDCHARFDLWAAQEQYRRCCDPALRAHAPGYCDCVASVVASMQSAPDPASRRTRAEAYESCQARSDAMPLPPIGERRL